MCLRLIRIQCALEKFENLFMNGTEIVALLRQVFPPVQIPVHNFTRH